MWAAYFSAASVLALVFLGSFAYFSLSQEFKNRQAAEIAAKNSKADKKPDQPATDSPVTAEGSSVVAQPKDEVKVVVSNDKPYTPEAAPLPREIEAPLTAPTPSEMPEINPLQLDKIRLSKFFTPAEIAREPGMTDKLLAELKKDELIRADLFCVSPAKTLDQLTAAMSSNGIQLIVDANLKDRIRRNQPTEIVLFVDSMTPADMVKLFTRISQEEEKKGTAELDTLVVAPFMPTDLTKLGRLLGASNVFPKVPAPKTPVDIRKPLPDGTASEIAKSLSKMGNTTGNPAKADRVAIALAYSPMNANPANSREVRTFLDRRGGDRKPETKPLMLVLLASK